MNRFEYTRANDVADAVRQIAVRRLENTRTVCGLLSEELREDMP